MTVRKMDTTPNTYVLFLDMIEIEQLDLVKQVVNKAKKHPGNPILVNGNVEDWDASRAANWASSMAYDDKEKLFKIWYYGTDDGSSVATEDYDGNIGYAYSEDGVNWIKPKLGLHEYKGSKENNICILGYNKHGGHFNGWIDDYEPDKNKRFKALASFSTNFDRHDPTGQHSNMGYIPFYSPDGIHWTEGSGPVSWPAGDTGQIFVDINDSVERRYKSYGQNGVGSGPDIENMKEEKEFRAIDPRDGNEQEIHFVYVMPYSDYYIMLYDFNRYRPFYGQLGYKDFDGHPDPTINTRQKRVKSRVKLERGDRPSELPEENYGIYTGDIRLAINRQADSPFTRIQETESVVARGNRNEWDNGFLVLGGGSIIPYKDEIYIFYTGITEETASSFPGNYHGRVNMGLATLRKDGFTHLQAKDPLTPGSMTTKAIECKNTKETELRINCDNLLPWRNWIEVEVLDGDTGTVIEGYSRQECSPIFNNGLSVKVIWNNENTLRNIKNKSIKLRFWMNGDAKLYSFTFK